MGGAGAGGMGGAFQEKLCSNQTFEFTPMQTKLWEAFEKEAIALHQEFMRSLVKVAYESDSSQFLFQTLFDKMHLTLNSIKVEKFRVAESNLESLKMLLDYKEG